MITSLVLVTLLYMTIAVIATGVLPLELVAGRNTGLCCQGDIPARALRLLCCWWRDDCVGDDTELDFRLVYKRLVHGHAGWLAAAFSRCQEQVWYTFILLTLFYIVGMLPIVTGMTLQYVTILGNAVGIIFGIIPVLGLVQPL